MTDFDYGNARLRAMKSRLLPRRSLEELAEAGSVQGLITALTNTAYREAVEMALVRLTGIECLAEALRNDLVATLGKARAFFSGSAGDLAALVLRRYDVHNLKTVLRGLERHVPANEILANILPVGELRPADLAELARAASVRVAIDLLATWGMPLARPLLELRAVERGGNGGAELFEMELALDRWHMRTALEAAATLDSGSVLREALALDADAVNILTALRLVGVPAPHLAAALPDRAGSGEVMILFVGPGRVPFDLLADAAHQESVPRAVERLAGTPYAESLMSALDAYAASARLSVFEHALAQRRLRFAAGLLARDPLGIGVLLSYVALKTTEVTNIRAIAQGLMLGEKPDRIRAELMFVVGSP